MDLNLFSNQSIVMYLYKYLYIYLSIYLPIYLYNNISIYLSAEILVFIWDGLHLDMDQCISVTANVSTEATLYTLLYQYLLKHIMCFA